MATTNRTPRARADRAPPPRSTGTGGTLLGIFIGLLLGLGLAAGVAYYLMGGRSAYQPTVVTNKDVREPARETPKVATTDKAAADKAGDRPRFDFYKILPGGDEPRVKADAAHPERKAPERPDRAAAEKAAEKSAVDKAAAAAPVPEKATPKPTDNYIPMPVPAERVAAATADTSRKPRIDDRYWLQVGSYSQQADAENMKAQIALSGLQAAVQTAMLDDKSVRFRVRLGPYDNSDELARVKAQLAQRGFEATAIRY
jgi:cell division protein FtsN